MFLTSTPTLWRHMTVTNNKTQFTLQEAKELIHFERWRLKLRPTTIVFIWFEFIRDIINTRAVVEMDNKGHIGWYLQLNPKFIWSLTLDNPLQIDFLLANGRAVLCHVQIVRPKCDYLIGSRTKRNLLTQLEHYVASFLLFVFRKRTTKQKI